ncbi:hypothetical protein [Providencia rustigianii]|uniref:hypothetical protein n=1 Tax=Providencia rustigianii TaxID=158850 RepID=UPI0035EFF8CE
MPIVFFGSLALSIIIISYISIPQVKYKIDQSLYSNNVTSNRDVLIKSRLPAFTKEGKNLIFGVGYGSVAYDRYLHDNNTKKVVGAFSEKKNAYVFHNDDPFFSMFL